MERQTAGGPRTQDQSDGKSQMGEVTPMVQPPQEHLLNALQIAQLRCQAPMVVGPSPLESLRDALQIAEHHVELRMGTHASYVAIANALKRVVEGLSEPNEAAISVATTLLRAAMGPTAFDLAEPRLPRDTASVILNAQVTGYSPEML